MDLRDVHQHFWDVWAGREDEVHSAETKSEKKVGERISRKPPRGVKVVTDLRLGYPVIEHQACLLQWAQQRKDLLRKGSLWLCCPKIKINGLPLCIMREFLNVFYPSDIDELDPCPHQFVSFLDLFVLYFGKM